MEKINVVINYVDLGFREENDTLKSLIMLALVKHPKIPETQVIGVELHTSLAGIALANILNVLQVPTLNLAKNVPAVLEIDDQTWLLRNFIDENIVFDPSSFGDEPSPSQG
jgi:PII-like signaling protein